MSLFDDNPDNAPSEDEQLGDRWTEGDETFTINPANDPKAEGGYYVSIDDQETGEHNTTVYNPDDTLADTKANQELETVDTQSDESQSEDSQPDESDDGE